MPVPLLFDLDGTLVDSAITIALALGEVSAARGGGRVDVTRVRKLVSQGAAVLVREGLGPVAGDPAEDLAAFRAILADIPADPGAIYPGVIDSLTALAAHPCAVVTNKPERLARLLLDELNLTRFFDAVVGGDTLTVCKPDPAPLLHALGKIGADRAGALMIGDSMVDAAAAQAARMPFLLFEGGYGPVDKDSLGVHMCFRDFAGLPPIVAQCGPAARVEPET